MRLLMLSFFVVLSVSCGGGLELGEYEVELTPTSSSGYDEELSESWTQEARIIATGPDEVCLVLGNTEVCGKDESPTNLVADKLPLLRITARVHVTDTGFRGKGFQELNWLGKHYELNVILDGKLKED